MHSAMQELTVKVLIVTAHTFNGMSKERVQAKIDLICEQVSRFHEALYGTGLLGYSHSIKS